MLTIDYSLSAKIILINLINETNGLSLLPENFFIGQPEVYVNPAKPDANTKAQLKPITGTGIYGEVDIYYRRMDVTEVFSTEPFDTTGIDMLTITKLSDLMPYLNDQYGIVMKPEDYYDTDLPAFDPQYPNKPRQVTIATRSNSYFFTGTFELVLGITYQPIPESDGKVRLYLACYDGYTQANVQRSIQLMTADGLPAPTFSFMYNLIQTTTFEVSDIFFNYGLKEIVLNGNFNVEYTDLASNAPVQAVGKSLYISVNGAIAGYSLEPTYKSNEYTRVYDLPGLDSKYVINPLAMDGPFKRYQETGFKDSTFVPKISYIPMLVKPTLDGKIYTVSDVLTMDDPYLDTPTQTQVIRIDRLLSTGDLDPTFGGIYIQNLDPSYPPLPVSDILDIKEKGFFVYFNPLMGVGEAATRIPVINNVSVIAKATDMQTTFCWNPVIKFNQDGTQDAVYNPVIGYADENAVYTVNTVMNPTDTLLWFSGDKILSLIYRENPLTGFKHPQLALFDMQGSQVFESSTSYVFAPKWVKQPKLIPQSNGKAVMYGTTQLMLLTQRFSQPKPFVCLMNSSGNVEKELFTVPAADGINSPVLKQLFLIEI